MATPGFTAECGLYRSSGTYQGASLDGADHLNEVVVPALCNDAAYERCIARNTSHMPPGLLQTSCLAQYGCILNGDICVGTGASAHCIFSGVFECGGFACPPGNPCCEGTCCSPGDSCCNGACCAPGNTCDKGCCINPIGSSGSLSNYIINNGSKPIDGLTLTLVSKGLVASSGAVLNGCGGSVNQKTAANGFSLQFNAYSKAAGYQNILIQFIFQMNGTQIYPHIQYAGGTPDGIDHDWVRAYNNPFTNVQIPNNTLPANFKLAVEISTDRNKNVNGATFIVTDNKGKTHKQTAPASAFPSGKYAFPISEVQTNLVGTGGGLVVNFQSGGGATITYASNSQLCVEGGSAQCASYGFVGTCESSNAKYGSLS